MIERLWDAFVDNAIALFMPLVCSYYTLTGDLFLNVSAKDATGFEKAGNTLLIPFQYICAGREAIPRSDGSWEIVQRFDYRRSLWPKVAASVIALPPSLVLGCVVKGLSYFCEETKKRHASISAYLHSTKIKSNLEFYQKIGIAVEEGKTGFLISEGHARRPGDEHHLEIEKKALKDIAQLLNKAKIPWWVDCGTCLGTYRYGGVIPWDFDIDIAVLVPDFENVRRALIELDPNKYILQDWSGRDHPNTFYKVYIRESKTLIDIYHFAIDPIKKEIRYILSLEKNIFFPEFWRIREGRFKAPAAFDTVFPLKKSVFDGIEVYVPNDTKKYLQRYYGENLAPAKVYDSNSGYYEKDLNHPYWQRAYAH